jgi:ketosteroid isomerase-like protein
MRTIISFTFLLAALLAFFAIAPSAAEKSMLNKNMTFADNLSTTNEMDKENLMEQENLMTMKQTYADFQKGNISAVLNSFTQDGEYISPGGPEVPLSGVYSGKEEIEGFFRNLSAVAQFTQFEPQEYIAKGDKVVSRGFEQGLSKLSGMEFSSEWAAIAIFSGGKISRFQFFEDTASIVAAYPTNNTSSNSTATLTLLALNNTTLNNMSLNNAIENFTLDATLLDIPLDTSTDYYEIPLLGVKEQEPQHVTGLLPGKCTLIDCDTNGICLEECVN